MHVGIDLGTSNSAIASFDGETVHVIPNSHGEVLTPSVVRLDGRRTLIVGRRAQRFLDTDPANTRAEFKRLMGTAEQVRFEAAGVAASPEELSAHILSSLLKDAESTLGFVPRAAVISTPALFELPQNHATTRAANLAGLEEVALIQEPIASAIAAGWGRNAQGLWLVFDLGGGTLDVSLLETTDGWLRVVDHGGDNFLGGKDFDAALVDWAIGELRAAHDLPELGRTNPSMRRALARLKVACEQAKIDLSREERTVVSVPELCEDAAGRMVEVDLPLDRARFEALVAPLVQRSLDVCLEVITQRGVPADAVEKVVFVGGPTLTPLLRARVAGAFGGRVAEGVDPMTIVARGAALYAATAGLEATPRTTTSTAPAGLDARLEHPAVTADPEPWVVGRLFAAPGEALPVTVRVSREDGRFETPAVPVAAEGSFALQVALAKDQQNRFRLRAAAADGSDVPLRTPSFAIVHGISVADPPLSRSVGVALSDDTVHVYFKKGTPLPARRTYAHLTAQSVAPGEGGEALRIPVVQGEYHRAHRNRLIGTVNVSARGLRQPLPAGSRVEVTLHLDRSGQLRARADVPETGESFENVVHVMVPSPALDVLSREVDSAASRAADVAGRGLTSGIPAVLHGLDGASARLAEARAGLAAAEGGDADATQRVHRLLLDLNAALDRAEDDLAWPELETEAMDVAETFLGWVSEYGTPAEQRAFDEALGAAQEARAGLRSAELDRQIKLMQNIGRAAWSRHPEALERSFEWYSAHVSESTDLPRAQELVERGRRALRAGDRTGLRETVSELHRLLPGTTDQRLRSFGSGVH